MLALALASAVKERFGDRFWALDTPLLVEWEDGGRDPVVFAIEQETDPRRFSPHRLMRYWADLAEMHAPYSVVPVEVFLGAAEPPPTPLVAGRNDERFVWFNYVECRLAEIPAERWRGSTCPT